MALVTIDWDLPTLEEVICEICPAAAEASELQARHEMHQRLFDLCAAVDAALETKTVHLRDCDGRLITRFDEWLAAAEAGRWPAAANK